MEDLSTYVAINSDINRPVTEKALNPIAKTIEVYLEDL